MAARTGVVSGAKPRVRKKSLSWAARSVHIGPWLRPSNVTVPIITHTTATVPGTGCSAGSPASGGRSPTTRSRVVKIDSRAKRPK